jgi:hypothetical protein
MRISTKHTPTLPSVTRHLAAALLAPALMLWLAAGCSSTATPRTDGAAGSTGSGGASGSGGSSGPDSGDLCAALTATYNDAYQRAIACNPAVNSLQCTQMASQSLPCPGCVFKVHDKTELDQIRAQYDAAHCPPVACPAIACINPGNSDCVPVDGGTAGRCAPPF